MYNIQISPIFNVSDIYPFEDSGVQGEEMILGEDGPFIDWKRQLPQKEQPHIEAILDKRVSKKIRDKEYFQYLVKWKFQPSEDVAWMK